jgi:pyruvate kinase
MTTSSMTGIYRVVRPPTEGRRRRTKVVATLGPASDAPGAVKALALAGMDVARLNFSHGEPEDHRARAQAVRAAERDVGRPLALMADLCGPKIRLGQIEPQMVEAGQLVEFAEDRPERPPLTLPVSLTSLASRLRPQDRMLIEDGRIRCRVVRCSSDVVTCLVEQGGVLRAHKGVNLPDSQIDEECLTPKDLADLQVAVDLGVEFVALSFVRSAEDVIELKERLRELRSGARVIAKIERPEAVKAIDSIVRASDVVMVARGDLGVEMGPHEVPLIQKQIIAHGRRLGRAVITATQMLETMIREPEPTRAEVSDVANAILDGTSAVMLSAETATGDHPVHAVEVMAQVAERVEADLLDWRRTDPMDERTVETSLMQAACDIAGQVGASAIVVPTNTGSTPRQVSRFRPAEAIVAACTDPSVARQLAIEWGVVPVTAAPGAEPAELWDRSVAAARSTGLVGEGDLVVLTGRQTIGDDPESSHIVLHRVV